MTQSFFVLEPDKWLSSLLLKDVYNLSKSTNGSTLTELVKGPLSGSNKFVCAKFCSSDMALAYSLQNSGFYHVETSLSFYRPKSTPPDFPPLVRRAKASDLNAVLSIAKRAFVFSRFHTDPFITVEAASLIKAEWVHNFFKGLRGDGLLVTEYQGKVCAFLQYLYNNAGQLVIDLIAVDPEYCRKKLGASMLAFAAKYCARDGHQVSLLAGTQASNKPAINLYIKLGFSLTKTQNVFHFHSFSKDHQRSLKFT